MHASNYVNDSRTPDAMGDTNLLENTSNNIVQTASLAEQGTKHLEVVGTNPQIGVNYSNVEFCYLFLIKKRAKFVVFFSLVGVLFEEGTKLCCQLS